MGGSNADYRSQIDTALRQANTPKSPFAQQYTGSFQGGAYNTALTGLLNGGALGNAYPLVYGRPYGPYGQGMWGGAGNANPGAAFNQNQPQTSSPVGGDINSPLANYNIPSPANQQLGGQGGPSSIFMGDPNRPGAGYINYNGKPMRIMGTTAAGINNPQSLQGASYYLDDGTGNMIPGPLVNANDYNNWVNAPHGPDANSMQPGMANMSFAPGDNTGLGPTTGIGGGTYFPRGNFNPGGIGGSPGDVQYPNLPNPNGIGSQQFQYGLPPLNPGIPGGGNGYDPSYGGLFPQIQTSDLNQSPYQALLQGFDPNSLVNQSQINPQNSQYFQAIQQALGQQYNLASKNLQAQFGAQGGGNRGTPGAYAQAQLAAQSFPQIQSALGGAFNQDFQNQLAQRQLSQSGLLGTAGLNQQGLISGLGLGTNNSQFNAGQQNQYMQQYMAMLQAANQQQIQNQFTGYQNYAQLAGALAQLGYPGGSANVNLGGQSQTWLQQLGGLL